jgi:hypothetical protein
MILITILLVTITISWNDNSDNEDGFTLVRRLYNEQIIDLIQVPKDTTQYIDTLPDGVYCYKIKAYNSKGDSAYSNEACNNYPLTGAVTLTLK